MIYALCVIEIAAVYAASIAGAVEKSWEWIFAIMIMAAVAVGLVRGGRAWLASYLLGKMEGYQNKLLERQCEEIDNTYQEMRGWRHDYKNHMQVLKIYVENRKCHGGCDCKQ